MINGTIAALPQNSLPKSPGPSAFGWKKIVDIIFGM